MSKGQNTAWSFSRLMDFEKCPYMMRLKYLDKVETPPAPAMERGSRIHKSIEDYITGKAENLDPEITNFHPEINSLRERFKSGSVEVEGEWAFDSKWQICDWRDYDRVWVRVKLDSYVHLSDDIGVVIDEKTGSKYGNEIKHAEQAMLYAGTAFIRHPEKKKHITEFHYLDKNDMTKVEFKPEHAAKALISFEKRANIMLNAAMFPPRPNIVNCKFCPYGKKGNGYCKVSA
jgi:CRISPR/Cas system-associated exonuclease Cas4 (RecB family)